MERSDEDSAPNLDDNRSKPVKGKSCRGTLYYSSVLKSKGRAPRCFGLSSSLKQVPSYIVSESEAEAAKEGRTLTDFRYSCLGYSVHLDKEDGSNDGKKPRATLPVCVGIELLVDKRIAGPASSGHPHSREDVHGVPQPQPHKPVQPIGDDFLTKFTRNAGLVASGVARNMNRVGIYIKDSVEDVFYPFRKRPK